MKKCPFCAEEIQDEAILCRFCGRQLVVENPILQLEPDSQPKNGNRTALFLLLAVIAVFVIGAIITNGESFKDLRSGEKIVNKVLATSMAGETYEVRYKIKGTTSQATYTLSNKQRGTQQGKVTLPWSSNPETFANGDFVYLAAQNVEDSGEVTCEIWLGDQLFKTSTSSGAYVIATCSGIAGGD